MQASGAEIRRSTANRRCRFPASRDDNPSAAAHLREPNPEEDGDVLVFGNNNDAREAVVSLVAALGLKGWHAGSIHNSVVGESLPSVLIFLNKRYDIDGAGIRITGSAK